MCRLPKTGLFFMLSHFHHDHIQGLAFNGDLLRQDRDIFVSSALYPADKVKASLQTYFDGVYFPIDLINHKHQMRFVDFDELGGLFSGLMEPHSMPLAHPVAALPIVLPWVTRAHAV